MYLSLLNWIKVIQETLESLEKDLNGQISAMEYFVTNRSTDDSRFIAERMKIFRRFLKTVMDLRSQNFTIVHHLSHIN